MSYILPIVERFHSLQGEGMHVGKSAFFIRLAGCKVGCEWCDTKESWSMALHQKATVSEIAKDVALAKSHGASIVIITGGEPLHHNLNELCAEIKQSTKESNKKSIPIHLETSGVDEITGIIDWITLSPKPHREPKESLLQECDELKIVIHEYQDLIFAENMAKKAIHARKHEDEKRVSQVQQINRPYLFLQPGWNSKKGKQITIDYIKSHPEWRLSLQAHKWLGIS